MIEDDADRYLYEDFKYLYHRKEKNFETALAAYRKASAHHDDAMSTADNHEIDRVVQQFHEEQLKIVQKRTLKHYTFVALLLLLIMIGISLGYLCYSRRQMKRRIDAYHQLQKSLEQLSQHQANQDAVLLKLYKEKYHAFVSLTERCNKSIGSKDEQKFLKELKKVLNSLKTPEFRLQIENDINSYRNHIIRDLRQQVPTISEAELAYIIYSQAGFPLPIIEQFLEVNQRKLYYYRDCIKKKIAKANAPDMDRFLRELL
jgi:tetratricopeptide (TPR) repeat protein